MTNFKDTCIDFFKDETLNQDVKEMIKPIFHMIYNEVYIYLWVIAVYNLFVMVMILAMFFIMLRLLKNHQMKYRFLEQLFPALHR